MIADAKLVIVYEQCPECKTGNMIRDFTETPLCSYPPKYPHKCNQCGHIGYYMESFPCQKVVPVESLRKMTEIERDGLEYEL